MLQSIDRIPPQNLEAEQGVLGSMLLDRDAIARVVESLRPEDFYRDVHRTIYTAVLELFERGEPVDLITITNKLSSMGKLEDVGGATYLASLPNAVPTAANADFYAGIVLEKAMMRALISAGTHIAALGYEGMDDVAALIDQAEKLVYGIAARRNVQDFQTIKEILKASFEKIDKRYQEKGTVTGIATGFTDLDMLTSGLQPADMVIVAARPSVGKCLSHDAEILLEDGSIATIEEIARRRQGRLLTLGPDWTFRMTEPVAFVDDGIKPVFRVTTRLGRRVECTAVHPFLTRRGWLALASLRVGERIAVPRRVGGFGDKPLREYEIKLLAYLTGEGSQIDGRAGLPDPNRRIMEDFAAAVRAFDIVQRKPERHRGGSRVPPPAAPGDPGLRPGQREEFERGLRAAFQRGRGPQARRARMLLMSPTPTPPWTNGIAVPAEDFFGRLCGALAVNPAALAPHGLPVPRNRNPLVLWLMRHELWGDGAGRQGIPAPVFRLPRAQLALFLNRLLAIDGWALARPSPRMAEIGYATVSERLARQVQHLLVRFGIVAGLRRRWIARNGRRRQEWKLAITDPGSLRMFAQEIGLFGRETLVKQTLIAAAGAQEPGTDAIPSEKRPALAAAKGREAGTTSARDGGPGGTPALPAGERGRPGEGGRSTAQGPADQDLGERRESDIYWDEVVSIERVGLKQVYDLTIPETHNFVANDICVHNTTFATNIAQHAAIAGKIPVAIFSLETSKEQLVQRILCSEARVDNTRLRTGFLADEDWRKLARAMGGLSEAPIFIDDSATLSVMEMRAKARKLKTEHGLGLVVIDYMQMIQSFKRAENRTQELSEIARGIKSLAKELDIPIIAISQLSRAVEALGSKRPMLSHLRESGEIEQVADLVIFLYREDYYDPEKAQRDNKENVCEVIIAKHRNGPIGQVELFFHKEFSRFENLEKRR